MQMDRTLIFDGNLGMGLGQARQTSPDFGDAREAMNNVMYLIDRKSEIDPYSEEGIREPLLSSDIEMDSVNFTYPSRLDTQVYMFVCSVSRCLSCFQVLDTLGFHIKPGHSLALVGESGSGKSSMCFVTFLMFGYICFFLSRGIAFVAVL